MSESNPLNRLTQAILLASTLVVSATALGSSHREAPFIAGVPHLDGTDFYMFRSYEEGRSDFVTILANYFPLEDPYGGPNYFDLFPDALYEIHIDNDGDSIEDLTFTFEFETVLAGATVPVGGRNVPIPLVIAGPVGPERGDISNVNSRQEYTIQVVQGDRRTGQSFPVVDAATSGTTFKKPLDNIGTKTFSDYPAYAADHIRPIIVPGCSVQGRVFVGQRKEGFAVSLGPVFDLVNLNPHGAPDALPNQLDDKNVTTLALELPIECLVESDPVIGAWTTSSLNFPNTQPAQVSRLGFPLVNEVIIGLPAKDTYNASEPIDDGQFADFVAYPTMPFLLELLFSDAGADAPSNFPRTDLVAALGGVPGLNQPEAVASGQFGPSEQLRLNTSIAPKDAASQNNLGVLGGDTAGFPNGRRPGDDVVDAALRVLMGALNDDSSEAPNNEAPFTDQVSVSAADFKVVFPYLRDPIPGSQLD